MVRHDERSDGAGHKPRNIGIRPARPLDATPLYKLLAKYFEEAPVGYPPIDEKVAMAWGLSVVIKGGVTVAIEDNRIIGTVGLEMGTLPWCNAPYLNAVWLYVVPERRAGGTPDKLVQVAKDIAAKNKMPLRLDNIWGLRPEAQDRWRRRHGFTYVGGNNVWFPAKQGGA